MLKKLFTGAEVGLNLFGQRQAEKNYTESVAAIINSANINAQRVQTEAALKQYQYRYQMAQTEGATKAAIAASGGSMSGSALDVIAAQDLNHKFNLDLMNYQAGISSRNIMLNARNQLLSARAGIHNARITTAANVINIGTGYYAKTQEARAQKNQTTQRVAQQKEYTARVNNIFNQQTTELYGNVGIIGAQ